MRVIAGTYKGRTLQAPKGRSTRPTTDRMRESLFSTLVSLRGGLDAAVVLDAFAGSGALGVEALSRGAAFACLSEKDRAAQACMKANTSFLPPEAFRIARIDIDKTLPPGGPAPFDLVFFDPPYARSVEASALLVQRLDAAGLLASDMVLSFEHARATCPHACPDWVALQLECVCEKTYGEGTVSIYRKERA